MSQNGESNASEEQFRLGKMFLYKAPNLIFLNKNFSKQT